MPLIEFYGLECPHCRNIEPLVARLEQEGHAVERYEIWHNADNRDNKFRPLEKGRCGGVPFLINTETDEWICGEADYATLKSLAEGKKIAHE